LGHDGLHSHNYVISLSSAVVGIRYFAGNGDCAEILAISNYQLPITNYQLPITLLTICLSVIVIWQHYNLRRLGAEISDCPTKYWWLGGLGGALVAAIAIGSAIKTETGWGWTWRGRPLQIKS
jgi:hypothetical protein